MVSYARQVSYSTTSYQNDAVLLQIVTDTRNVDRTFHTVHQSYSCDLAERGVRLLGRSRRNGQAYASLLRALLHDRNNALFNLLFTALSNQLIDCWHLTFYLLCYFCRNSSILKEFYRANSYIWHNPTHNKNILHKLFSCVKRLISKEGKIFQKNGRKPRFASKRIFYDCFIGQSPRQRGDTSVIFTVALASRVIFAASAPDLTRLYASDAIIAALSVHRERGG